MSELTKTAPERIWLQVGDDRDCVKRKFPADHEGITWCQDSVMVGEVEYVRADLAAAPAPEPDRPVCISDHGHCGVGGYCAHCPIAPKLAEQRTGDTQGDGSSSKRSAIMNRLVLVEFLKFLNEVGDRRSAAPALLTPEQIESLRVTVICDCDGLPADAIDKVCDMAHAANRLVDAEPIGEVKENGVVWFNQNPHAHPVGTLFYAAPTNEKIRAQKEAKLEAAIKRSQAILAEWIVPDSGIADHDCLVALLGVLDDQKLVKLLAADSKREE